MNNTHGADTAYYNEEMVRGIFLGQPGHYSVIAFEEWKLMFAAHILKTYNKKTVFV